MGFKVRVLADSLAPCGERLITIEGTYPRSIHSEVLTHRKLSRSSASSRAIPAAKLIGRVDEDPFLPIWWGKNEPGMQAWAEVEDKVTAMDWWLDGKRKMVDHARRGMELGLHKQIVNRVTECYAWITVIISTTSLSNFFGLRVHKDAEPHFQRLAGMMQEAVAESKPRVLAAGEWHMPLVDVDEEDTQALDTYVSKTGQYVEVGPASIPLRAKISCGRAARVSYLTHDGRRDIDEDLRLYDRLMVAEPLHASPAEHVAQALDWPKWWRETYPKTSVAELQARVLAWHDRHRDEMPPMEIAHAETALASLRSGNFTGFRQLRKLMPNEHIGGRLP